MRTRNAGTPKTSASQKKSPTSKKSASKTSPSTATATAMPQPTMEVSTPELTTPISSAAAAAADDATLSTQSADEQTKTSAEGASVTPPTKGAATPEKKVTRTKKVIKKVLRPKTPASAKAGSAAEDVKDDPDQKHLKAEDVATKTTESEEQEEPGTERAEDSGDAHEKGKSKMDVDNSSIAVTDVNAKTEPPVTEGVTKSTKEPSEIIKVQEEANCEKPLEEVNYIGETLEHENVPHDQLENMDDEQKPENMDADDREKADHEAIQLKVDDAPVSEEIEDYGDEECFVEPGEEDLREDDEPDSTDDTKELDEEHKELAAAAKERKIKKEHEIFVNGLDREVVEEDVKKIFEKAGEVVEVRLLKDPITNKNRGFAFVRFSTKDEAKKALSEMKNPVICGKRCGTAASEDNDTLFVGNICNTWTKEAIKQKLKDYNLEGVESITLVQDPRQEGLSRGFCFIQFACHADAMSAYKRLQKPDAIFGHAERTAKVAFAEPLQEPDPEVMAKVKSVFVDGLPPFWDEDRVRKHFKCYGEIERVTLARNMSSAKRKDFGFVDYTTHEAATACIEDVNRNELVDGDSKTKVRARLSNPLPKLQAVKGGMCGGFRIGRPTGRSLGRPAPPVNRPSFQHGRMPRGPFYDPVGPYGRRVPHRGGHGAPGPSAYGRPSYGGFRHGFIDRGPARPVPPRREPFPLDYGGYSRSYMGRHYDDSYMYDDSHGLKRPFYLTEQDSAYMEPSRARLRFDYSASRHGPHFRDSFGAGPAAGDMYSSAYYGTNDGARPPSSFNGRDRSYGSGGSSGSGSGRGGGSGYYY